MTLWPFLDGHGLAGLAWILIVLTVWTLLFAIGEGEPI